jgi:transposase
MFVRTKTRDDKIYLMIVENKRVGARTEQTVLHSLGRLDKLLEGGGLDALIASLARFSEKLAVLGAVGRGDALTAVTRRIGPALVFERLWRELGVGDVIRELSEGRKFGFDLERAIFLTVLHRLFDPGSDRAAEKWKDAHAIGGAGELALQHLYRAMAWLGTPLPLAEQRNLSHGMPRTIKDRVEEELFARRRDLLTTLDMVFFDTTSIYFEGQGGESMGQHGFSKDHRPDLKQLVVGMVLDDSGTPICSQILQGNATDVKSLLPVRARLERQFAVERVCLVADRGMISKETMAELDRDRWPYILGARLRQGDAAMEKVLCDGGAFEEVFPKAKGSKAPSPLKVKEVKASGRRYVMCFNEDQATKDRHDREAIVASLQDALKSGDKALIGNKGFKRYVAAQGEHFMIDTAKVAAEARYDGLWVLCTNTDLPAREVAIKYKQLWMVEDAFRSMKSLLSTRPIWHQRDETIVGHVFCSFLALLLRKRLQDRLEEKGWTLEWADVIRDVEELVETEISVEGKGYVIRSEARGVAGKVARAVGVALPPTLRPCVGSAAAEH